MPRSLTASVSRSLSRSLAHCLGLGFSLTHSVCPSLLFPLSCSLTVTLTHSCSFSLTLFITFIVWYRHQHTLAPAEAYRIILTQSHSQTHNHILKHTIPHCLPLSLSQPICLTDREIYKTKYERKKVIKEREWESVCLRWHSVLLRQGCKIKQSIWEQYIAYRYHGTAGTLTFSYPSLGLSTKLIPLHKLMIYININYVQM